MSYCKSSGPEGKDKIIFLTEDDAKEPSNIELPTSRPADAPQGLITESGEINWDCPCLGGMAVGPCGVEFREAFSCFHYSKEEPKGADCLEAFQAMQDCMKGYPELYDKETQSVNLSELDSDDKVQDEDIKEENKNISASEESSATNIEQSNSNDSSNDSPIVSSAPLNDAVQSDNESSALSDQLPPSSETEDEPLKKTSEDDIDPKSIDSSEDCDDNDKEAVKIES